MHNLKCILVFPILFILSVFNVTAQPKFTEAELKLLKTKSFNPNIYQSHFEQERFPMPEVSYKNSLIQDGDIDNQFNPLVTEGFGYVNKTVTQSDGKIIAVGDFHRANGMRTNGIARFNADGSIDSSFIFGSGANAAILTVALQNDGKIVIGGAFTSFNGISVNRVVRLNSDGTPDSTFNQTTTLNGQVNTLLILPDGKFLVGGEFSISFSRLIKLNSDGSFDSTIFGFEGKIFTIINAPNNKILVGGIFSLPKPNIARLNSDLTLDSTFNPSGINGFPVFKLAIQSNNKIIASGVFSTFNGVATDSVISLNEDGTTAATFNLTNDPEISNLNVSGLAVQPDGKFLIGFFNDAANSFADVRRFNSDGTPDTSFNTNTNNSLSVTDLNLQSNGQIIVSGYFDTINNQPFLRLAKLNSNGSLATNFNASASSFGTIYAIKRQTDGKILIGGDFEYINGVKRSAIARLNADGSLDMTFSSLLGIFGDVFSIGIQTDGKIIIGGIFSGDSNFPAYGVARLNSDGSFNSFLIDSNYFNTGIYAVEVSADNKILIGGQVYTLNSNLVTCLRFMSDGTIDSGFTPIRIGTAVVRAISIQDDGKIIIGGSFQNAQIFPRIGLARLNSDGSLNSTIFGGNAQVYSIQKTADGSIYSGGFYLTKHNSNGIIDTSFDTGSNLNSVIRAIKLQPDGKILVAGAFTTYKGFSVNRLMRVEQTGALDSTFNIGSGPDNSVNALESQNDGKILAGGAFTSFNSTSKFSLVRLNNSTPSRKILFDYDGDGKSDVSVFRSSVGYWYLNNTSNGFSAVSFGISNDKIVPADYDGDGKTDISVFRDGNWYRLNSSNNSFSAVSFGQSGDIPISNDFDGDGKADQAVFRNGNWYINQSASGFKSVRFGQTNDKPVAGDFDGDSKADIAVYREGNWYYLRSTDNGFTGVSFGISTDIPVPSDYDGDGKTDIAVYRNGNWYILQSQAGFTAVSFGISTDIPVPADYDGDGKSDLGVFRNGNWYLLQTANGFNSVSFGIQNDKPTQSAYIQ